MAKVRCTSKFKRWLTIILNVIVLVAGLVILIVGKFWDWKVDFLVEFFGRSNSCMPTILMVGGVSAAVLAVVGIYGSYTESVWILIIFVIATVLMLVAEVGCLISVFLRINWFTKSLKNGSAFKPFQWYFSAILGALGASQILALVFVCCLVRSIKKCR